MTKKTNAHGVRMGASRAPLAVAVATAIAALAAPDARAVSFNWGEVEGNIDTTVSYGISVRVEDRDDDLVGKAQFDPTLVAQIAALQAQNRFPEAQALQVGARGRFSVNGDDGNLNYDQWDLFSNTFKITSELSLTWRNWGAFFRGFYFYDFENAGREDLTDIALEKVGEDLKLLDAFIYTDFEYGEGSVGNVRLGRQVVSWGESTFIQNGINVINPVDVSRLRVAGAELKEAFLPVSSLYGSFSLTENLSIEGVYLFEFEEIEPDPVGTYFSTNDFAVQGGEYVMLGFGTVPQPVDNPENFEDVCLFGQPSDRTDLPPALVAVGCSAAVPRAPDRKPSDSGQWGLALRYFASELNDTEFGFFYLNYHSRLPLISGIALTTTSPTSGRYFIEYPEDIELWGASFNTTLPGGWAWQGEVSYRPNMPLQIDDVEVLFAALSPLNPLLPGRNLDFISQLGEFGPGEEISGWDRHEVTQAQFTLTKLFANVLGAQQVAVVGEVGATKVWDLPSQDVLRYQGDGTDTGGGPDISSGGLRNPLTLTEGFPTSFSWGYRVAARADYNNAFGSPMTVSPRVAFNHDVNGTTPGPGGNFLEDRKSLTLGVEGNYLNKWIFDISYTSFFGGEPFNLIADRDFASFTVKYSF
ncbi:MAG TPA: DUF1302 domain-containing protein [Xanthomonadaceae bacterium]|nr:DUF1302 domain-containing protein [Xanthomonadaceae bacterium]